MNLFTHSINRFALKTAALTAGLGILQTLVLAIVENEILIIMACVYVLCAFIIHAIILLLVLVNGVINYKQLQEHIITLFVLLLNIPLTLLCTYIIFEL